MQLSEAIRLGAMMKPQAYDSLAGTHSCTLRAAAEAVGIQDDHGILNYPSLESVFPILKVVVVLPESHVRYSITNAIFLLNDCYQWTRERIADWVEEQERALGLWDAQPVEAEAVTTCK